ncbi:ABC1 kinase family protein [Jeotgalibaca sp. A122]|uniref:ABC1 kinase family protein n=1 Tax=Jeotgalibaca sp. A122 TaxID=3457322 RepID=UPI003FD25ADA
MADDKRLREIVRVLSNYGFRFVYHHKVQNRTDAVEIDAVNLRKAFEKLGPSFIKIGQILSTRLDILPQAFVDELTLLQDRAPEFPFSEVERIFLEDTGLSLGEVFLHLDEKPLASASMAQVHKGTLRTGEVVILKVQRPVIDELLIRDLDILIRLSDLIPKGIVDVIDPKEAFQQVKDATMIELDFRNEAKLLVEFQEKNKSVACVAVPKVYEGLTRRRVLVEEYIEGTKITNKDELELLGYDMEDISQKLILSYLKQIFKDGYFHGDPHPGNMIIKDGKIYFIDFGIMGKLSETLRLELNRLIEALALQDLDMMVKSALKIATPSMPMDKRKLYRDLEYIFDVYLTSDMQNVRISEALIDFIKMFKRHSMVIPSELTILAKALSILEGVYLDLAPDLNLIRTAKEYLAENINVYTLLERFEKEKVLGKGYTVLKDVSEMPENISTLLKQIINGRLRLNIDTDDLDEKWADVKKMSNRVVMAIIIVGLLLSSSFMSSTEGGQLLGQTGFVVSGLFGIWLLYSIFRSGNL